jgi:hypothetical protein
VKTCNFCKQEKEDKEFYRQGNGRKDLKTKCKQCYAIYAGIYEKSHRKEFNLRVAKYRKRHPDRIAEYKRSPRGKAAQKRGAKNYREKHRDYVRAYTFKKNKEYWQSLNGKFHQWRARVRTIEQKHQIKSVMTREQWETFWQKPCSYCKSPIKTIGIDRIDNSQGYSIENCVPCCMVCNRAKGILSLEDFKNWILALFKAEALL